ncbi:uncharacterized protein BDCG_01501 [Blastomyces dermatitidis ER-3]|uniref:Uncharacterized protein n=2 Tax=Ajellomyces dermatitidis TaxID=5039 RepID=F2TTS4_AJEDA|nr:uncharacterized protein BDCG_01501 [Blastomyces dermatitidis ER-3]EEQ86381.2 hypothetical protein BDCG_01501 [Blastomyces dermatitidis ER-3]EGE86637.2 hypothetical protein BDDG_09584 [Blastomyces dermatitidis ATCC 18188]
MHARFWLRRPETIKRWAVKNGYSAWQPVTSAHFFIISWFWLVIRKHKGIEMTLSRSVFDILVFPRSLPHKQHLAISYPPVQFTKPAFNPSCFNAVYHQHGFISPFFRSPGRKRRRRFHSSTRICSEQFHKPRPKI